MLPSSEKHSPRTMEMFLPIIFLEYLIRMAMDSLTSKSFWWQLMLQPVILWQRKWHGPSGANIDCNVLTLFKGAIVLFLYIFISLFIIFCFKKAFKNHLFLLLKFMQLLKNFAPSRGGRGRPWSHMQGGGLSCTVLCWPMRWLDSLKVNLVLHS